MLKKISSLSLMLLVFLTLTSCGSRQTLLFLNWGEYIDESLLDAFEDLYDCNVVMDLGESNEIFYSKVRGGTTVYDVVCPSDYMVEKMYMNDMLAEIDFDQLPSFDETNIRLGVNKIYDDMNTNLKNMNSDYVDGTINNYFVPYLWGTWGIMYTTLKDGLEDAVTKSSNEWSSLFDRSTLPSGTKVAMYDSYNHDYYAACRYLGYDPHTELADSKLNQIRNLVAKMKYDAWGTDSIKKDIVAGNIDLGYMWTGDFLYYYAECAADVTTNCYINGDVDLDGMADMLDILTSDQRIYEANGNEYQIGFDLFIPSNTVAFCDNLVITKDASNKDLAHKFIDFMISGSVEVNEEELNPSFTNTYYVDYDAPYISTYNELTDLADTEFTEDLLEDFSESGYEDSTLYWTIYDYVIGKSFLKYYELDGTKGNILATFDRKYVNKINTAFNNART